MTFVRPLHFATACALTLGACGGGTSTPDDAAIPPDASAPLDTSPPVDDAGTEDARDERDAPATPDAFRAVPDAYVSVDATPPTMPTYSYVLSVIAADEVRDGAVAGVDVDALDSGRGGRVGTCEQRRPDFVSSVTGLAGVDNQLSNALLSTLTTMGVDINANLRAAIEEGEFLLLITIDDLEDFVSDPDGVSVTIAVGQTVTGAPPTLDSGTGLIAAGQSFRRAVTLGTGTATLAGNRVSIAVPRIPIPLVLGGTVMTDLTNAQLSARISATELFDGEGGGGVAVSELVAFAASNGFGDIAMTLLPMFSDLDPSEADPSVCDAISAGFRMEAVSATVVP